MDSVGTASGRLGADEPARDGAPLSSAQQRLWFLEQLEPGTEVYNSPFALDLEGPLDIAALEWALTEIVRRHHTLRTVFPSVGGQASQHVTASVGVTLRVHDRTGLAPEERAERVSNEVQALISEPFDIHRGPLFRADLLRLGPHDHVLVFCMHHIVTDGWSMGILFRELALLYEARCEQRPSPLPELPLQFADFARRQQKELEGEAFRRQLAFWKQRLQAPLPHLNLPTDRPRPAVRSTRGTREPVVLPPDLVAGLKKLSRERSATMYMTFLAAYAALLHRYTGQEDLIVGVPVANRTTRDVEGLIGFFINTLAIRLDLSGDPPFVDLLNQVKDASLSAFSNQGVPFERLVEELQPERIRAQTPIVETLLNFRNMPLGDREARKAGALTMRRRGVSTQTAKFDLTMTLHRREEEFVAEVEYSHDLFERSTAVRLLGHYQTLLESVLESPAARISRLRLLTSAEQTQLDEWQHGPAASTLTTTVADLFEEIAAHNPAAEALVGAGGVLTYRQLNARANRLAHHLQRLGAATGTPVALCLDRSVDLVVAMIAVLKSGGAYVPLDAADPAERLSHALRDAGVRIALTSRRAAAQVPPGDWAIVCLDDCDLDGAGTADGNPQRTIDPDSLAYVIFTSGSTGRPKGVAVAHRGIVRLVKDVDYVDIRSTDVFLHVSSPLFDVSTFEIWAPLLNGAKLVVAPPHIPTLHELGDIIERHGVTTLWLTSALFREVVDEKPEILAPLRQLLAGGDVVPVDQARKVLERFPQCRLINGYGPTECTTFACCHDVDVSSMDGGTVPIGKPIAHTDALVLDQFQQRVPVGVPGELYLGGPGLALGYVGNPELTNEKFIQHPFDPDPRQRLYRTGDLVRWRSDGALEFLGRRDRQIKLRGFRIELDEVENALREDPRVREAVVLKHERRVGDATLVAYVTVADRAGTGEGLREALRERLPAYMVPSVVVVLDAFPLTATGKLDRRALPDPEVESAVDGEDVISPRTPTEESVARIWCRVLGVDQIGVRDDFFAAGGHSLLAVRLMAEIEREFDVALPLTSLFDGGTIEQQAGLLDSEPRAREAAIVDDPMTRCILPIQPEGTRPPFYLVHGIGGEVVSFGVLSRHVDPNQPIYGLRNPDWALIDSIEKTASLYVEAIRRRDPIGPYLLGGYSAGGAIAYEMAQQLRRSGSQVIGLIALDCGAPGSGSEPRPLTPASCARALRNLGWWVVDDDFLWNGWANIRNRLLSKIRSWRSRLGRRLGARVELDVRDEYGLYEFPDGGRPYLEAYLRALRAYRPEPYPGRITLLRSRTLSLGIPPPHDLHWGALAAGGVEVKVIRGDHNTILQPPRVTALATALDESLRAAQQRVST